MALSVCQSKVPSNFCSSVAAFFVQKGKGFTASSGEIRPSGTTAVASMQIAPTPRVAYPCHKHVKVVTNLFQKCRLPRCVRNASLLHVHNPSCIGTWGTAQFLTLANPKLVHLLVPPIRTMTYDKDAILENHISNLQGLKELRKDLILWIYVLGEH